MDHALRPLSWMLSCAFLLLVARPQVAGAQQQTVVGPDVVRTAHSEELWSFDMTADGRWLATGHADGTIRLWQPDGKRKPVGLDSPPTGAAWDALIPAALKDWQPWARTNYFHLRFGVRAVAISPDGRLLASANVAGGVKLWEVESGREIRRLAVTSNVWDLAFSPDGHYLAAASGPGMSGWRDPETLKDHKAGKNDGRLWLWETGTGRLLFNLNAHPITVFQVAFRPDGGVLASLGYDNMIRLWRLPDGRPLATVGRVQGDRGEGLAFSPDGGRLATAASYPRGSTEVWDAGNRKQIRQHANPPDSHAEGYMTFVAFSPDGRWLVGGGRAGWITVWEAETGREVKKIRAHSEWIENAVFRSDSRVLASASRDKTVKLWDTGTWNLLRTWMPPQALEATIVGVERTSQPPPGYMGYPASSEEQYLQVSASLRSVNGEPRRFWKCRLSGAGEDAIAASDVVWEGKEKVAGLLKLMENTGASLNEVTAKGRGFTAKLAPRVQGDRVVGLDLEQIDLNPGESAPFVFVFRVPKEAKLDELQLQLPDELPLPLTVGR